MYCLWRFWVGHNFSILALNEQKSIHNTFFWTKYILILGYKHFIYNLKPVWVIKNSFYRKNGIFWESQDLIIFNQFGRKKNSGGFHFLKWPPKPIHSVPVPKRKKIYWFWWSADHFSFRWIFFTKTLIFFTNGEIGQSKIINGAIISLQSDLWLV